MVRVQHYDYAVNLGETYLTTETGNERLDKTKIGFGNLVDTVSCLMPISPTVPLNICVLISFHII